MRLLVGFDRRDGGRDALEFARVLGAEARASVLVATVMPYDPFPMTYQELLSPDAEEAAEPGFEEAREGPPLPLPAAGAYIPANPPQPRKVLDEGLQAVGPRLAAEGDLLGGPPAETLAAACEDADLLVAGSRGYGPLSRVLLGSVTTKLIGLARCPVLVVPRR